MESTRNYQPYCGRPPLPTDLWERWNFDPLVLAAFALAIAVFLTLNRRAGLREHLLFLAALGVLVVAFVSPLCALTTALFSARVAHHVLLVACAAPLLALSLPATRLRALPLSPAFALHTLVFWAWHAPDLYALALSSDAAYWLMQASLLGTAIIMWRAILTPPARGGGGIAALLGSAMQMGLLGALLTFAPLALYEPHLATTVAFGLTPIADQQLSGALMWVLGSLPYLGAALLQLLALLGGGARSIGKAG